MNSGGNLELLFISILKKLKAHMPPPVKWLNISGAVW